MVKDKVKLVVGDTPKVFAESADISLSALYSYMSGRRMPSAIVLYKMSAASGYPMEWFLDGSVESRVSRV
ncbi:MAG: helix-turn-helix domain-containing protein [Flavobacteriaceae bacterium]